VHIQTISARHGGGETLHGEIGRHAIGHPKFEQIIGNAEFQRLLIPLRPHRQQPHKQ
jgi:hypothetical protein